MIEIQTMVKTFEFFKYCVFSVIATMSIVAITGFLFFWHPAQCNRRSAVELAGRQGGLGGGAGHC